MTGVCDGECDAGWKGFLCDKGLSISILNCFLGGRLGGGQEFGVVGDGFCLICDSKLFNKPIPN